MLVTKEFSFDSAHFLTDYHGACENLHGHTYKLQVTVEGKVQKNGLVIDFAILSKIVKNRVLEKVDHKLLNDFLPNPSVELLAEWIWEQLKDLKKHLSLELLNPNLSSEIKKLLKEPRKGKLSQFSEVKLFEIKLWETPQSFVTYNGQ